MIHTSIHAKAEVLSHLEIILNVMYVFNISL